MRQPAAFLASAALATLAAAAHARDITTLDGKTYKDVEVYNATPAGIVVGYKGPDGNVVRQMFFKDLPDDIRKEYNYNPERANAYMAEYDAWRQAEIKQRQAAEDAAAAAHAKDEARVKLLERVDRQARETLARRAVRIQLRAIYQSANGVVGWCQDDNGSNDEEAPHLGKICVLHLTLPQGFPWVGVVYPIDGAYIKHTQSAASAPMYQNYLFGNYYVGSTPSTETVAIPCYAQFDLAYAILREKLLAEAEGSHKPAK